MTSSTFGKVLTVCWIRRICRRMTKGGDPADDEEGMNPLVALAPGL